jgi:hypothetical protein
MIENNIPEVMEQFHQLVNGTPPTEAADSLARLAATHDLATSITALARLYVLTAARLRYAEAKFVAIREQETA